MKKSIILILAILFFSVYSHSQNSNVFSQNWPSFRGQFANGIFDNSNIPLEWNFEKNLNIAWKTSIPGLGHSSPIIWGDKIFITTAVSENAEEYLKVGLYGDIAPVMDSSIHEFKIYCLDKNSGKIIWERLAHKGVPKVKRHTKSSHANPTPATDGKHLVVFFGSEGLFCYDFKGKLLWKKDLGVLDANFFAVPSAQWGFASSPIIYKDRVIVQCDVYQGCFLASFDVKTGEEIWRTERDDYPTWGTPAIYDGQNNSQIVLNGFKHIGAYNFETGEKIWWMKGGGDIPVPTPIVAHNTIFINSAHGKMSPIYAISPKAVGDISLEVDSTSNDYVKWSIGRGGSYMQTPLVYGDYLYNLAGNGLLSCYNAKTGELIYKEPLKPNGGISASGVASDGKLYFASEAGDIFVVKAGPEFEILSKNPMGEICMASPAIVKDGIYIRTQHHLVKITNK
ncbi:MAG: pyrrolo-quinoline quinone [Bacteroidetes bacterium HGW-Bacteroidetes-17]|jgi:outer membrane protein assembly factor BamB|nr:MAG: pyrrolo-quinoline quinone [Bacteroidetes bacterium HGW-Bacteroidetes-17]